MPSTSWSCAYATAACGFAVSGRQVRVDLGREIEASLQAGLLICRQSSSAALVPCRRASSFVSGAPLFQGGIRVRVVAI